MTSSSDSGRPRVLWVGRPTVELPAPCGDYEIIVTDGLEQALEVVTTAPLPAVLVVDNEDPKTVVLQICALAERAPAAARLCCGRYEALPDLIREGASYVVEAVVSRTADPVTIQGLLRRHVARNERVSAVPTEPEEAAARTIAELARLRGTVVRPLGEDACTIELVVASNELQEAHAMLPSYWGWPIKARGEPHTKRVELTPGVRLFGVLTRSQEAYTMQDQMRRTWFLLLFPWSNEPRTTLILGIAHDDDRTAREDLEALHSLCLNRCAEFPVPTPPRASVSSWYASDYGWVVTPTYVGPDRRAHQTSLFNRFMIRGRRKQLLTVSHANRPSQAEIFVDRLTPQVARLAALYLVLSAIDTALTITLVGRGDVRELNPLLAPLLSASAGLFLFVKNGLSLSALLLVVRFQAQRLGRLALWVNAALYAALDVYWLYVIAH